MDGSLIVANWMAQFPGSNSQFGAEIAYRNSPSLPEDFDLPEVARRVVELSSGLNLRRSAIPK